MKQEEQSTKIQILLSHNSGSLILKQDSTKSTEDLSNDTSRKESGEIGKLKFKRDRVYKFILRGARKLLKKKF